MKKTSLIIMAAALMAAACDKIEQGANGEYTQYAGSTATWTDGTAVANHVQRAYVEKYTGPRCTNCPAADRTLEGVHEQQGDNLVLVAVNSMTETFGAPGPNSPDMRTEDGAVWEGYWGIGSFPTAYINRGAQAFTGDMTSIAGAVQDTIASTPVVAIEGKVSGTTDISIDVNLEFVQAYEQPLTLTLVLTQDSLAYWQLDGTMPNANYVHNHMLRDVITDAWGADIDCTGAAGECRKATYTYSLPDGMENWHVVALVCDKATHRVLNSVQCE